MKKIKQHYPRRGEMLQTPFQPLSEDGFRDLVTTGRAIPGQQGTSLFVSKWKDGPGVDVELFLTALSAQGSKLEVRAFKSDVNVRVVRSSAKRSAGERSSAAARKRKAQP